MKLLFLSLFLPHARADHAASFCGYHLLRHLSRKHEVTLLSLARSAEEQDEGRSLRDLCRRVEVMVQPAGLRTRLSSRLGVLALRPISFSQCYSPELAAALYRLCEREHFDALHAEYIQMGLYVTGPVLGCARRGLHVLDLMSPQLRKHAAHQPLSRKKFECWLDAVLAARYEIELCSRFHVVFACAPRIRERLQAARPDLEVIYVPPGVEVRPPHQHSEPGKHLLFVGAMWRQENVDAILWFYHQVFPRIRAEIPDATLTIVGGSPAEAVQRLASAPEVRVTGFVDNLAPWYDRSDVSIAPVRIAGGVLCKVLDAMGAGLPVIATTFGNEGVGAQPGQEIMVADTPEQFAKTAVHLLRSAELRRSLSANAREFIRRRFSTSAAHSLFEGAYIRPPKPRPASTLAAWQPQH